MSPKIGERCEPSLLPPRVGLVMLSLGKTFGFPLVLLGNVRSVLAFCSVCNCLLYQTIAVPCAH